MAALSELKEELGLETRAEDLEFIAYWKQPTRPGTTFVNNTFYTMYLWRTDIAIAEMTPQPEEVAELMYVPLTLLRQMVEGHFEDFPNVLEAQILLRYLNADL